MLRPVVASLLGVSAALLALIAFLFTAATASAKGPDCGSSRIVIEGGDPSPFILPDNAGDNLRVEPQAVLLIRGQDLPPDSALRWSLSGLGMRAGSTLEQLGSQLGSGVLRIEVADYSQYARGLYQLEGAILRGGDEVCAVEFRVNINGFGGVAGAASAAATGVAGAGALASVPLAVQGTHAKVKLSMQIQRRRPKGWRRWLPVPAWKRTIVSTVIGAFTGLFATVLLQQGGIAPLSLVNAVLGIAIGGGVTFGVGYCLGAIWTYVRPPVEA